MTHRYLIEFDNVQRPLGESALPGGTLPSGIDLEIIVNHNVFDTPDKVVIALRALMNRVLEDTERFGYPPA